MVDSQYRDTTSTLTRTTMSAIQLTQYGGPEVLRLSQVPIPHPGVGEVLIRVQLAAVNGADLNVRAGRHTAQRYGFTHHPVSRTSELPIVPGMEVCGEVVALGEQAPSEWLGRRVIAIPMTGGYAQYVTCPLQRVFFAPIALPDEQVAASGIAFLTAYYMLSERIALQPYETILITVASGVAGSFMVQMARQIGARVLAVIGHPDKAQRLIEIGLPPQDIIVRDQEELATAVSIRTKGQGVDILLDAVGGRALRESIATVRPGGQIVLYGNLSGVPAELDATRLITAHQTLFGFSLYTYLTQAGGVAHTLQLLWDGLLANPPQLHVPIGQSFALEEVAQAHIAMQERRSTGKTLLRVA
ncbi:MAG TPA: zinc-binding alcohol dehydrogenase family protein [Ktedonosporobacter sp.]|nr:zinc-binding alcohol dehydrogenase family protein [Ktedonosporobacter sp.]